MHLYPLKTGCGCPSGGGIQNGHIHATPPKEERRRRKKNHLVLTMDLLLFQAEQDVVVTAVTPEALRDNHLTLASDIQVASSSFFGRKVHITVKLVYFGLPFDSEWEADGFLMSPPCLESHGCLFDPTFLYSSSLVLLPSPVILPI